MRGPRRFKHWWRHGHSWPDGIQVPGDAPPLGLTGSFTLTVIRNVTEARRVTGLALVAVPAEQARLGRQLLDSITTSLYNVGLSLQAAADLPRDAAGQAIAEALGQLDDTIREIRNNAFATCSQETHPAPRNGAG